MPAKIEKDWTELDFKNVDFKVGGEWNWSQGGHPLGNRDYAINHVPRDPTLPITRYRLPDCIAEMIRSAERSAADDARAEIRRALGI